ncbi:DapH/DapD/GlmU-related protein [Dokdonia sp. Hel_I_53]|uniref:DapH/DapD/GlmU-related protein n=1 Tax=Dokdonia sp. Hel_I_53 TaxID=1566287 RepID=UPI0011990585|nr:DapH/DapD/GlmU-related protein [Dokdonia sp. Hel_I_53]TVZ53432.1 maltose O-acetyltransferase [Dokdonia sp. Hel_I_53]
MLKLGIIIQSFRIWKYKLLSTNESIEGAAILHQPAQINGKGHVRFRESVHIGVTNSPQFYNTYAYIEARQMGSEITFGSNVAINNNFCAIANESYIHIGDNTTIGMNCAIYNCNFHSLDPEKRRLETGESTPVIIGKNVFIGNNVSIWKGVTIADNVVIPAGSIVTKDIAN